MFIITKTFTDDEGHLFTKVNPKQYSTPGEAYDAMREDYLNELKSRGLEDNGSSNDDGESCPGGYIISDEAQIYDFAQYTPYEIVDGKQRMLTLLAFYENRFPYKGVFYNDLSAQDKNWFMDASIGVAEIDQSVTRAEVLEIFLAMNEGGKPVAKEVLDHARKLLNEEKGKGL